jgi:hypothetical protein
MIHSTDWLNKADRQFSGFTGTMGCAYGDGAESNPQEPGAGYFMRLDYPNR